MSNTVVRIISAFVMLSTLGACFYLGKLSTTVLVFIAGILVVDEISCNFFSGKRKSINYLFGQLLFVGPFIYYRFIASCECANVVFMWLALFWAIGLIFYLFTDFSWWPKVQEGFKAHFYLSGLFVLFPIMSLVSLLDYVMWLYILIVLIFINFGMDTGAWFFGKNFGKHKLWERVSPKKTIEGLIGGMLTSGVLGCLMWFLLLPGFKWYFFFIFALAGAIAQIGDLIQSKCKRYYLIKDSSNLIPGHGGIYDRIDSLLFLSPFYVLALTYLL
jgi:phosphatidate cytidylyltransferase